MKTNSDLARPFRRCLLIGLLGQSVVNVHLAVPVTPITLSIGNGGLVPTYAHDPGTWPAASITSEAEYNDGAGHWLYTYTFTGFSGPALSHFIVETSDGLELASSAALTDGDVWVDVTAQTPELTLVELQLHKGGPEGNPDPGNPGMPSDIYGLRLGDFEDEPDTYVLLFASTRSPILADAYFKAGGQGARGALINAMFGTVPPAPDYLTPAFGYLWGPDTVVVPEPAEAAGLAGLLLTAVAVERCWRRRRNG